DKNPTRLANLCSHCLDIGIFGGVVLMQKTEPVAAQLDQPLRVVGQPDDQWSLCIDELGRQWHPRNQWDIRRLDPPIGQIKTGWRLRRARDADKTNIGVV